MDLFLTIFNQFGIFINFVERERTFIYERKMKTSMIVHNHKKEKKKREAARIGTIIQMDG